jgi:CDP-glucose 4,6-dehydratase
MGGHDPYSASKGCAEIVFGAYLRSFFSEIVVGAASVRAGNVIGGGDWGKDRLIPDCIRALSSGQAIGVRNPSAVRPWQHVLEPLGGYLALGARLWNNPSKFSGSWNFGPDEKDTLNVGQVTDLLIKNWGSGSWKDLSDPNAPHEAHLLKLNCDKVHAELGWHATFTVDECVSMTSEWYKKFYEAPRGNDMYPLCVTQIKRYEELAASRYKL